MKSHLLLGLAVLCGMPFCFTGCEQGGLKEEIIHVKPDNDPLHVPRQMLRAYSDGKVLGEEASTFPNLVEKVRERDKIRANILEKGFAELQEITDPEAFKAKAAELSSKIQPSMGAISEDGTPSGYPTTGT